MKSILRSRRKLILFTIPALVLLLVVTCALPSLPFLQPRPTPAGTTRPSFTNHPAPSLKIDLKPFQDAGCKLDPKNLMRCPTSLPPFDKIGCDEILEAPPLLGGLKGGVPVMLCVLEPEPDAVLDPTQFLFNQDCQQAPYLVRLIAYMGGQFQLIKSVDGLKAAFTPLTTPEEALSYTLAATGLQALYGLKDDNMRYLTTQIEDTRVQSDADGFTLALYSYGLCGCAPHTMSYQAVKVNFQGDLKFAVPQPIWEDPTKDEVCRD
jgi:hypothetical protein